MQLSEQDMERVLKDFRVFIFIVWRHLNLPPPTDVQNDIALFLQNAPKRSIIQAFRGVGKSWLTSAFVVWLLLRNPQTKIMVVSASKDRADAFSSFVKRIIHDLDFCEHLRAREGQRDSMISFDVGAATPDHSPSVKSVGITGQLTGSRADIIIADDVEVPNNSATQMMRDKLSEAVKEFDAILKPLPTSKIIYLGTPQCEMSLYNTLLERGYMTRIWPSEVPTEASLPNYKGNLAPFVMKMIEAGLKVGSPVDPKRFDAGDLLERKLSYGRQGYSLQFMLDTALSDADKYPLRLSDLIVLNLDQRMAPMKMSWANEPEYVINELPPLGLASDKYYRPMWVDKEYMKEYEGTVMAIDPSGRGKDETGFAVVSQLAGNLFLRSAGGLLGGYSPENLQKLVEIARAYEVKYVIIESNFGDGMFTELIKPWFGRIYPCTVEEIRHSAQKEARIIDVLEPVMSSHRLVVDFKVIKKDFEETQADPKYSLFYQMTRLTRDRGAISHDDRIDAVAMAVSYWVESMARDNEKASKTHKEKLLDKELKKFMQNALGSSKVRNQTNWNSTNRGSRLR